MSDATSFGESMSRLLQMKEAVASVALDRDQTHVVGEVTVSKYYEANADDPNILEEAAAFLLERAAGLDVKSPHGRNTPTRFVRMLKELTTPAEFNFTTFENDGMDEMITLRDMPFVSMCNHHIIPFMGFAYIAYVPHKKIAGLSKFPRAVNYFAKGLQTQERLTGQITDFLENELEPEGLAVVLDAEHMCMTIRGVQSPGTMTRTSAMRGVFADHDRTAKSEFMSAINGGIHR